MLYYFQQVKAVFKAYYNQSKGLPNPMESKKWSKIDDFSFL